MRLRRPHRSFVALFVLFSVVFAQLALAAYQCPGASIEGAAQFATGHTSSRDHVVPGCDGMDTEQPNLCQAHAQDGNQSVDKPHSPLPQPFVAAGFALVLTANVGESRDGPKQFDDPRLGRIVGPPIAISNCCYRI